jgi:trigger factor
VEHVLTMLQFEYATAEAVEDRAVKENDRVHISLSAELVDPEEDEEKDIVTNQSLQVITNQEAQSENEWPFPEFWKELVGLAINDKKKINHTYDDQAPFEKLRGKSVEFNITVDSLYALILPDLNDEFAHQVNDEFHTLSEFQEDVRKQLQENRQAEYDDQYIDDLIKEIVENSEVKYSPNTLEDEVNETIEGLERNLGRQGLDLQAYLSIIKKDKDTFVKEDIEPAALKRLKRSFVIQKIIESEDIQLDSEQLEFEVSKTLHALGNTASQRNLPKGTNIQDLARAATYETANRMLNNRVLSLLKSIASGEADIQQDTSALEDEITDDNQESTENISENVTDDKPEQTDTLEK